MNSPKEITQKDLEHAASILKAGGVVVFPTETAYGLAADATNEEALSRVCTIKHRDVHHPFPMIAADKQMVETFAVLPEKLEKLASRHWPGPLTLELSVKDTGLASRFVERGIAAFRVSSHPVATTLSKLLGNPIVSTSANVSGKEACYNVGDVKEQFANEENVPDLYLDAGELEPQPVSTIVGLDEAGKVVVYRQGSIEV